jgi:hypothetical protein
MIGAVHCEFFEAFKGCNLVKIRALYVADEEKLQKFPN